MLDYIAAAIALWLALDLCVIVLLGHGPRQREGERLTVAGARRR